MRSAIITAPKVQKSIFTLINKVNRSGFFLFKKVLSASYLATFEISSFQKALSYYS